MGWVVTELEGHPVVHSYGGERGFQSDMMLCPDMGVGVIAMGNGVAGGAFYSPDAATDVLGMVMDDMADAPAETATLEPEMMAEIEAMVEQTMEENQIPGVAIGIVKDGEPVYAKGFGVAELGSDEARDAAVALPSGFRPARQL